MRSRTALRLLAGLFVVGAIGAFIAGEPRLGAGMIVMGLLFGGFWLGGRWFRDRPRADAHRSEAKRLGLRYAFEDPHDLLALPHPLLHRAADVRAVEHVSWGSWMGAEVHVFEYRYSTGRQMGDQGSGMERFTCVLTPIPDSWPSLAIEPARLVTTLTERLSLQDLPTESEAFNRTFHVWTSDPPFGSAVVDALMIAWLLDDAPDAGFQLLAGRLLTFTPIVEPWRIEGVLATAAGFLSRIPRDVASLYP
jgi:hypothetical protein